eukprot:7698766-Pyramimonas_sp.AAC.1
MGFPMAKSSPAICDGAFCAFALSAKPPLSRSPASQRSQVGNCTHVNVTRAAGAATLLKPSFFGFQSTPLKSESGPSSSSAASK